MAGMIPEIFDAGKRIEGKYGHLDCLLGVNGWGAPTKVEKSGGGPCKQGQTAAETDCIPSTPDRAVGNGRGAPRPTNKPKGQLQGLHDSIAKADGGFTFNVLKNTIPKVGFAVSVHPERSFAKPAAEITCTDIANYVLKNRDLLRDPENNLGAWHNPEDGKVYLDVSTVKVSKEEAFKLGMEHDQLAGFDLAGGSSFVIDPKATSGGVKSYGRPGRGETAGRQTRQAKSNTVGGQGTNGRQHKGVVPPTDGPGANAARPGRSARGVGTNTNGPDNALDRPGKKPQNNGATWPYPARGVEGSENYG